MPILNFKLSNLPLAKQNLNKMALPNAFESSTVQQNISRIEKLTPETQPGWGKMNAGQMLAHLNVGYDIGLDKREVKYGGFMKFMLKMMGVKKIVNHELPAYKKNNRTAPAFIIADQRNFEEEKAKLIQNFKDVGEKGASHFEGKENPAFGSLTAAEWSCNFQKHTEFHLNQFGV